MAVSPARRIAIETLGEVIDSGAFVTRALSRVLDRGTYEQRDIGYGSRLAHLSVATYRTTSALLERFLTDPAGVPPRARYALAVAATELLYLGAPDHVVDQGVELMRSEYPHLTGLANAVLRKIATQRDAIRAENLGHAFGFDQWLTTQLTDEYGLDTAREVLRVSNEEAPVFGYVLSVAPSDWKQQLEAAGAHIHELERRAIRIEHMQRIRTHPLIVSRAIPIVDVSAQRAIELAPIGRRMLEIGCGRGTKTLLWADRARERFQDAPTTVQVIGVDNVARKIETARADAQRLGYDEITYQRADATVLDTVDDTSCDVVFVDAPCSGLGTLRRHSDKRLTLRPDDIEDLARLGRALMEAAARKVAKGGYLVYATCTMSRRENEAVVTAFLDTEAGVSFTPDPIVEAELTADITGSLDEYGFVQMRPRSGGGDGHFIARLKRD